MVYTATHAKISSVPTEKMFYRRCLNFFFSMSFRVHLTLAILLRLGLIYYCHLHDKYAEVQCTDIDYRVVTDGSRHILNGRSPFERHTYRYSPIIAYLQIPNVLLHPAIGKILYASFDILVGWLIYATVYNELRAQFRIAIKSFVNKFGKMHTPKTTAKTATNTQHQQFDEVEKCKRTKNIACMSACFWLYNPLAAVISTRGNGDSLSSFFVILTIYLLAKSEFAPRTNSNWLAFCAGLIHGFAIHLRLYPILFSLAYFLSLSKNIALSLRDFFYQIICPSSRQLLLVLGTVLSFCMISSLFYYLYGWQYLYETYFYHFTRRDIRHNFSLYFLLQYLGSNTTGGRAAVIYIEMLEKLLIIAPQFILFIYFSFGFGQFRQTLPFCVFSIAFVMVTFNSVITSQYFVWYLALLPLCLNNLLALSVRKFLFYFIFWLLAQGFWLLPAYLLEFKSLNTFYWIGVQGALFFLVQNFLLVCLVQSFNFTFFKLNLKKIF